MTNKKSSNQSTLIYAGDSSFGSISVSRIQQKQPHRFLKGLSFSLQNIKCPFPQTLPLKFPKNRIIKEGKSHILEQSTQPLHKPCIRPSSIRNKHNVQSQEPKSRKIFHKTNLQSEDNDVCRMVRLFSNSDSESLNSSPEKRSKRLFQHIIVKEYTKDPVLIGQQDENMRNSKGKKQFNEKEKMKNIGQGAKCCLQWKVDKQFEKQKFNNKCNKTPNINLNSFSSHKRTNSSNTQRKIQRKKQTKTERVTEKPNTYLEMYASRKIRLK